jgi:hypothetical protein
VLLLVRSKNEERPLPRKHIEKLADFLNTPVDGLLILWFSDKNN